MLLVHRYPDGTGSISTLLDIQFGISLVYGTTKSRAVMPFSHHFTPFGRSIGGRGYATRLIIEQSYAKRSAYSSKEGLGTRL